MKPVDAVMALRAAAEPGGWGKADQALATGAADVIDDLCGELNVMYSAIRDQSWRPIETAPRDGTLVLLLVEDEECPVEDTSSLSRTIGHNNRDNDGEDKWYMAGWCWDHDHFTEGRGTPKYWQPFPTFLSDELE